MFDLGGAVSVPLVRIDDTLGLYAALRKIGPAPADEIAVEADCAPRYVREWLAAQAASGYVNTAAAMVENQPKVQVAFEMAPCSNSCCVFS